MIRVGIGGWVFKPWRGSFYPQGLAQARELEYASRVLTTIEINGTFYGSQKPESFRRWAAETPDDFVFSVKGPRFTTHRAVLAEAGSSIERFFASGVLELKAKLGPVLWQFPPFKTFEPQDLSAFLALLPQRLEGRPIRHVVEVRHPSFCAPQFVALMREHADDLGHFLTLETLKANRQSLVEYHDAHRTATAAGFMTIYNAQTALSLPGAAVLSLAAGTIFGSVMGTVYATIAATIGAGHERAGSGSGCGWAEQPSSRLVYGL